ncbi:hypothetical protein ACOMHN_037598 [Nucella lapillus]
MATAGGGPWGSSKMDLESFLTCSICMEPFRSPKILPCVHSFCLQCLRSCLTSASGTTVASYKKKGGFPVPRAGSSCPLQKILNLPIPGMIR